jgi:hypothetical protein
MPERVSAFDPQRRALLRRGFLSMGMLATGRLWLGCGTSALDPSAPFSGARGGAGQAAEAGGHADRAGRAAPPSLRERSPMTQPPPAAGSASRPDGGIRRPDAGANDRDPRDAGRPMRPDAGVSPGRPAPDRPRSILAELGPLRDPDANGVRLPEGFSSRVLARSGQQVLPASSYVWHSGPDGGATFATLDGGFVYVSNCEYTPGGAASLQFDAAGQLVDAYPILQNTSRNCAGGPTPWGTWLSCEEIESGSVWECDPLGVESAVVRPALGLFRHEAAAVDPVRMQIYLTEDEPNGRLYRFTPSALDTSGRPNLSAGRLEVAVVASGVEGRVTWQPIDDPSGTVLPTRLQVPSSTAFNGAEGIWHDAGVLYFATKGDNRVWAYDAQAQVLTLLYDQLTSDNPILSGVDNVTVSPAGDVIVAEDAGGDMQLVGLGATGTPVPILQLVGHDGSELTGPAFDPSGTRLYFSSQRGTSGVPEQGITFEVTGKFFRPA